MKRLKVTLFSRYSRLGPSTRLRSLQYLADLGRRGVDVQVHALFPDAYLEALYGDNPRVAKFTAWRHYGRRVAGLLRGAAHDLAWIEGELFPYLPYGLETILSRNVRPYVVDYDDALFHRYGLSSSAAVRWMLGDKIDAVMRDAACVIAGNHYLAERARRAGATKVQVVPTVVDAARYKPVVHEEREQLVIGWIGSPATQHYLSTLRDVFREVCARHGARLMVVGARADIAGQLPDVPLECVPWSEHEESALLSRMDVGVMPLQDGPWERGKCGYKLVQYMACGLPVVASPVGVNADLVRQGENGFLPNNANDWTDALSLLLEDIAVRRRLGAAGRMRVETELCVGVQAPRLAGILREAVER
jgi:glycosyltransferase involved in cell wall biosynthesis